MRDWKDPHRHAGQAVPQPRCAVQLPPLRPTHSSTGSHGRTSRVDSSATPISKLHANRAVLARAYDLIVFPSHHEYVTTHEYDVVEQYRDLGGNLIFLYANNFFWQTVKRGKVLERTKLWRDLGRPEAALIGVQYRGSDGGHHKAPWIIRKAPAGRWLFAGTGLHQGSNLGEGSVEIDRTFPASPKNVQILAEIPNLFGPGFTAQMTYYDTPDGARVFAAGAFRLVQEPLSPQISRLLDNLWLHFASDRAST